MSARGSERPAFPPFGSTARADAGVWPPRGARGLTRSSTSKTAGASFRPDENRLKHDFIPTISPNSCSVLINQLHQIVELQEYYSFAYRSFLKFELVCKLKIPKDGYMETKSQL